MANYKIQTECQNCGKEFYLEFPEIPEEERSKITLRQALTKKFGRPVVLCESCRKKVRW